MGNTGKQTVKPIPAEEQAELEHFFKSKLAAAGESVKSALIKLNAAYPDRTEYYATTLKQVQGGSMPLWKFMRLASALGYTVEWRKRVD